MFAAHASRGMTLVAFILVATGAGMGLDAGLSGDSPADIREGYNEAINEAVVKGDATIIGQSVGQQVRGYMILVFTATITGAVAGHALRGLPTWLVLGPFTAAYLGGVAAIVWQPLTQLYRRIRWWWLT